MIRPAALISIMVFLPSATVPTRRAKIIGRLKTLGEGVGVKVATFAFGGKTTFVVFKARHRTLRVLRPPRVEAAVVEAVEAVEAAVVEGAAAARVQIIVRTAIPALTRRAGANVAGPT